MGVVSRTSCGNACHRHAWPTSGPVKMLMPAPLDKCMGFVCRVRLQAGVGRKQRATLQAGARRLLNIALVLKQRRSTGLLNGGQQLCSTDGGMSIEQILRLDEPGG